ncbi:MAG: hypothetical protein ACJAQT_004455 [Akkermansiaceae bacterium]|jgi:hypothetical protein
MEITHSLLSPSPIPLSAQLWHSFFFQIPQRPNFASYFSEGSVRFPRPVLPLRTKLISYIVSRTILFPALTVGIRLLR